MKTVFVSELDENAQKTYIANFGDEPKIMGDITKIDEAEVPKFDICLAGFPCQAFSIAGQKKGFDDDYKGRCRGTLFFDVIRICDYHKPKVMFFENVKGIVSHDKGQTFTTIIETIKSIGYRPYYCILNSKDFGVPQNRERIYIVAFKDDIDSSRFDFPTPTDDSKVLADIVEDAPVSAKYYLSTKYLDTLKNHKARHIAKGNGFGYQVRQLSDVAAAVVCGGMGRERNLILDTRLKDLTPVTYIKGELNKEGIRKMTPREWARLQGFPDEFNLPLADVHNYKQLGNSVTVTVIEAIAKKIKGVLNMDATKSGNIGEWSEIYAHLKILSKGRIYGADKDLNVIENLCYDINRVFRDEKYGPLEYVINPKKHCVSVVNHYGEAKIKIPMDDFDAEAQYLYDEMRNNVKGPLTIGRTSEFMEKAMMVNLKASSKNKSNIRMQVHDSVSFADPILEFSIKSDIKGPSTLLNSSGKTNFTYRLEGDINEELMEKFNNMRSAEGKINIRERMTFLQLNNIRLVFSDVDSKTFRNNMMIIDSDLHKIIAEMLIEYYRGNGNSVSEILKVVSKNNPLGYDVSEKHPFYEYKVKKLLVEAALGMVPGVVWKGRADVTGGYVVVREDGEVVCYHVYNRNEFEDYLLNNTKLDSPSTTRHSYADIIKTIDGTFLLKLNLQIRFEKPRVKKKKSSD